MISVIVSIKDFAKYETFLLPSIRRADEVLVSLGLPKIDLVAVQGSRSIAENYNEGDRKALFKVRTYVHEDVDLGEPNWVFKVFRTFAENPDCGMVGMVGTRKLDNLGMWWESGMEYLLGELYSGAERADWAFNPLSHATEAECSDGFFMAFPGRVNWDEKLPGFHFYDLDQSRRVRSEGKKILIVPHKAWHLGEIREAISDETWRPYLQKWNLL